ncbi:MAG: NAD-dependent epimerase/dehydratase family protein [Planctomycetota bacterium]
MDEALTATSPQRVFLSGGSGFVGTNVLEELIARGIRVSALVNSSPLSVESDLVTTFKGGLFDRDALKAAMDGCDAAIHLVGIIDENPAKGVTFEKMHVEATRNVLDAANEAGVERYVHMSALGTRPDAVSAYHKTKWQAEELVRTSGLTYTIFRPSLVHGPRGEFMQQAADWARGKALPFLFMPYFGFGLLGLGGSGKVQPVYVKDVAKIFVDALTNDAAAGRVYNVAGPDVMDWPTMHKHISTAVRGKPKIAIGVPSWYAGLLTKVVPASLLPFNEAQIQMAREDYAGDTTELLADFDLTPTPFAETVAGYAGQM